MEVGLAMCVNRMCKHGLYYELHSIAYLHISFISSVDMESISSGIHGVGGCAGIHTGFNCWYKPKINAHANTLYFVHVYPTNSYMIVST